MVGGFIIGISWSNWSDCSCQSRAITLAPFVAIMLVLILRPQGLFGGRIMIKKV